jgi:hypothetical protein
LGDRNPKWKEWWQTVQEFIEEQIHDNMELVHYDEGSYLPEPQAYQFAVLDCKYEPPSFVFVEIGTNSRIPVTPFVIQPITKLINPLKRWNKFRNHLYLFILLLYMFQ